MKTLAVRLMLPAHFMAAAIATLASSSASAGTGMTFMNTPQGGLVQQAVTKLFEADAPGFENLLSEETRSQYGSPEALSRLRQDFKKQGVGNPAVEVRTDVSGKWKDDIFVVVSKRDFGVDIMKRTDGQLRQVGHASVQCYTFSLSESFGGPDAGCKITSIKAQGDASRTPAENTGLVASATYSLREIRRAPGLEGTSAAPSALGENRVGAANFRKL